MVDAGGIDGLSGEFQVELYPFAQVEDGVQRVRRLSHGYGAGSHIKRCLHVAQLVFAQGLECGVIGEGARVALGVNGALQKPFLEADGQEILGQADGKELSIAHGIDADLPAAVFGCFHREGWGTVFPDEMLDQFLVTRAQRAIQHLVGVRMGAMEADEHLVHLFAQGVWSFCHQGIEVGSQGAE